MQGDAQAVNAQGITFSPQQVADAGRSYIDLCIAANGGYGIKSHVPMFAESFLPHVPGRYCMVVADTGNGKTFFMTGWANALSKFVSDPDSPGYDPKRIIVYVSLEDPIETHAIKAYARTLNRSIADLRLGKVPSDDIKRAWTYVQMGNVYLVGASIGAKRGDLYGLRSRDVYDAVYHLINGGYKPIAVFIDYATAFLVKQGQSKVETIGDDMREMVRLSVDLGVPTVVGAQARRDRQHDIGPMRVPQVGDVEFGYSISQLSTVGIGLWMPARTNVQIEGSTTVPSVTINGVQIVYGQDTIVMQNIKQNDGGSNQLVVGTMNFATGMIGPYQAPRM